MLDADVEEEEEQDAEEEKVLLVWQLREEEGNVLRMTRMRRGQQEK